MCRLFLRILPCVFTGIALVVLLSIPFQTAYAIDTIELKKLLASDGSGFDHFGNSVAVDGDTVVVGARFGDGVSTDTGSAYVFRWNGTDWAEHKLTASDGAGSDWFGASVAVDGDTVVVGAYLDDDDGSSSGSAYVFRWNGTGWAEHKLTASDGAQNDWFGASVAVDGDTVVVGAWGDDDDGSSSGSAYVFRPDGTDWACLLYTSDAADEVSPV